MDPFSLSVGIAGLEALASSTLKLAKSYKFGVKNAKGSVVAVVTELEALQSNLNTLYEFLRSITAEDMLFPPTSVLLSSTKSCEDKLKALRKKLNQMGDSRASRCLWPFSEKEHRNMVQELRAFAQCMEFALSIENCTLLTRTSRDVLKVMEQNLENFRLLQDLIEQKTEPQDAIKDHTRMPQDDHKTRLRDKIIDWISPHSWDQKHHIVSSPRVDGTGGWLLDRMEYVLWRDDDSAPSILWCHGIQGSGKTVLT
jgi:hypothetical protein